MQYNSDQLYDILNTEKKTNAAVSSVNHVSLDSRNIIDPKTCLFIAFKGKHTDGHKYIQDAYLQGVRHFLTAYAYDDNLNDDAHYYKSQNPLESLQRLAKQNKKNYASPTLAIIGSNGKTIVKEWLAQCLEDKNKVYRSPLSYNSQIGVALSLCGIKESYALLIIEAGISEPKEMDTLREIILPDEGMFTHLGDAHSQGFLNQETKLEEKLLMFKDCKTLFFSSRQKLVYEKITKIYPDKECITWGKKDTDACQIIEERIEGNKTIIYCEHQDETFNFELEVINPASVENCMHVINYLLHKQWNVFEIQSAISKLRMLPLRLEIIKGINNCEILNDSYTADLHSFKNALEFLDMHAKAKSRTAILSSFAQLRHEENFLQNISQHLIKYKLNKVICVGEELAALQSYIPKNIEFISVREQEEIKNLQFKDEAILIKGARKHKLDRIANFLQAHSHKAQLEVNLSALEHNVNFYKSRLKEETKLMIVLKADAYGAGSVAIARFLEKKSVDYFVVAMIDEGIMLRTHGIRTKILVLNPDLESMDKLFEYNLEPEIFSLSQLESLHHVAKQRQGRISVHINIDTGMHRLGVHENEILKLCTIINASEHIKVVSIFSHLAGSEDPHLDAFTKEQFDAFKLLSDRIKKTLDNVPLEHILNSTGILRFPQYQLDMVRLGLGMHGIDVSNSAKDSLRKVSTLKAYILQIKEIPEGDSVGYNRSYKARQAKRIATLNIGYADGLPRILSGKSYLCFIQGKFVPIIGNISMDLTSIDVTDLDEVNAGDAVEIFGTNAEIEQIAALAETISYEILSNISERVKRISYME